jgi:hypothetical protein
MEDCERAAGAAGAGRPSRASWREVMRAVWRVDCMRARRPSRASSRAAKRDGWRVADMPAHRPSRESSLAAERAAGWLVICLNEENAAGLNVQGVYYCCFAKILKTEK